jgi:hypothetical protein
MRIAAASLFVAATATAALLLDGGVAVAQPADGADVSKYEQCSDVPPSSYSCVGGQLVVRRTTTPSGVLSLSIIDHGRYGVQDRDTGCTTTGSFHDAAVVKAGPVYEEHVVTRDDIHSTGTTKCGDRTLNSRCLVHSTFSTMVLPNEVRVTSRIWAKCDPPGSGS